MSTWGTSLVPAWHSLFPPRQLICPNPNVLSFQIKQCQCWPQNHFSDADKPAPSKGTWRPHPFLRILTAILWDFCPLVTHKKSEAWRPLSAFPRVTQLGELGRAWGAEAIGAQYTGCLPGHWSAREEFTLGYGLSHTGAFCSPLCLP